MRNETGPVWVLPALLLFAFLIRLPFLHRTFEPDESSYALVAQEMLRGVPLYRGIVELKFPMIFFLYALGMKLFGFSPLGIHRFAAFYNLGTVYVLWLFGRRMAGWTAGAWAAGLYGFFSCGPRLLAGSNAEIFMALPYTLGAYFFWRALDNPKPLKWLVAAGGCTALAVTVKQVAAFDLFLFGGWWFISHKDGRSRWGGLAALMGGIFMGVLPSMFYLTWQQSWPAFYRYSISFGAKYSQGFDFNDAVNRLTFVLTRLWQEQAILLLGGALFFFRMERMSPPKKRFVGFWLLTAFLGSSLGGLYLPHYFVQLLPAMCLAAGVGWASAAWTFPLALAAGACLLWLVTIDGPYFYRYSADEGLIRQYGLYFGGENRVVFPEISNIASYIRAHSDSQDKIIVFGQSPEIYFFSERRPATKHVNLTVYATMDPSTYAEAIEEFRRNRPLFAVQDNALQVLDESRLPLLRDYRKVLSEGRFDVYRRPD